MSQDNDKDSLGTRIKTIYENAHRIYLPGRMPVILRIDGCHFSTLTEHMKRPFDLGFMDAMIQTTLHLCDKIGGCVFGYTQSDEISLVLINYKRFNSQAWFNNNLQKMCSVSASMATMAFNKTLKLYYPDKEGYFDCRAFVAPKEEVANIILWRQQDCSRNSVQMLARAHFFHNSLFGLNNSAIQDKLMLEKGINWNDLPVNQRRGTCVRRGNDGWVIDLEPPIFNQDRNYINGLLEPEEV